MTELIVWAEPSQRRVLGLIPGDITRAIAWFKEELKGQEPKVIVLNPRYERLTTEAPDGIQVGYSKGCLG